MVRSRVDEGGSHDPLMDRSGQGVGVGVEAGEAQSVAFHFLFS